MNRRFNITAESLTFQSKGRGFESPRLHLASKETT
jgi:hypothetical protein